MTYERESLDFWSHSQELLKGALSENGGVLCTVVDEAGDTNVLTLGWCLVGPRYGNHPIVAIAVCPPRYSWLFLESTGEFVLAVPDASLRDAVKLCGSKSGRQLDKFEAAGLTRLQSAHVRAPSIAECSINVECRTYTRVSPPHRILTPRHRSRPLEDQHTIYFAEAVGTYRYR